MPDAQWPLYQAKNRFSSVVDAAQRGTPQTVTKHGVPAVVVISAREYEKLSRLQSLQRPEFHEHLLNMPTDDGDFESDDIALRDIDL